MRVSKKSLGSKENTGTKSKELGGVHANFVMQDEFNNPDVQRYAKQIGERLKDTPERFKPEPVKVLPAVTMQELALTELLMERLKYPNVPSHGHSKGSYSDKNSKQLTKAIVAYFECCGMKAWRQSSEGRFREGETVVDVVGRTRVMKGTWLPGQNVGHADITAIIHGRFVAIEVKIGNDRQSDKQKQFEKEITESGAIYIIVKTWQDFINQITNTL